MTKQELWNRSVNVILGEELTEETKKIVSQLFDVLREYCYPEMVAEEKKNGTSVWDNQLVS